MKKKKKKKKGPAPSGELARPSCTARPAAETDLFVFTRRSPPNRNGAHIHADQSNPNDQRGYCAVQARRVPLRARRLSEQGHRLAPRPVRACRSLDSVSRVATHPVREIYAVLRCLWFCMLVSPALWRCPAKKISTRFCRFTRSSSMSRAARWPKRPSYAKPSVRTMSTKQLLWYVSGTQSVRAWRAVWFS